MARKVFFSFHFERDIWRTGQVRNSWVTHPDRQSAGYWDASIWEEAKLKGDDAIKKLIDRSLDGTSVTVVLIGAETAGRRWVRYEVEQSAKRGNGLVGIYINNLKDRFGNTDVRGNNPLDLFQFSSGKTYSYYYPSYDWVLHGGYTNLGNWIETAYRITGNPVSN